MKTMSRNSSTLLLCLLAALLPVAAMAQSKPLITPPGLEKIEELPDSGLTIGKPDAAGPMTKEKRVNGKVTEVEVQTGGSKYVVKADPEVGNAPRGTVQGDNNRAAQWTLFEFGNKKESREVELAPMPPTPEPLRPAPASPASR